MDPIPPEALLEDFPPPMQSIANQLRQLVRETIPEAVERVRPGWRLIGYDLPIGRKAVYFAYVAPEIEHVHLGFEHGWAMRDPDRLLLGEGITKQVRWLTFRAGDRIPKMRSRQLILEGARVAAMTRGERILRSMDGDRPRTSCWFARSFRAAFSAISAIRFALVSGRLASTTHWSSMRRVLGGKASQFVRAGGDADSASERSSGTMSFSTSSSSAHIPDCFASSITASPAGSISPAAVSRATRSLFDRAQTLRALRGANHWMERSSSSTRPDESIHPTHNASSTASSYDTLVRPVARRHETRYTPLVAA